MTPAPILKPLHVQLEEAEAYLAHRLKYGPDEDETQLSWCESIKNRVAEIGVMKALLREGAECAGCKEIIPVSEMEGGMCFDCWMKHMSFEAREER